jgi:hypothetical protein
VLVVVPAVKQHISSAPAAATAPSAASSTPRSTSPGRRSSTSGSASLAAHSCTRARAVCAAVEPIQRVNIRRRRDGVLAHEGTNCAGDVRANEFVRLPVLVTAAQQQARLFHIPPANVVSGFRQTAPKARLHSNFGGLATQPINHLRVDLILDGRFTRHRT